MADTQPKERPILMSGAMVQAILADRKTQTRRVMKTQPRPGETLQHLLRWPNAPLPVASFAEVTPEGVHLSNTGLTCPYGKPAHPDGFPGDRLWVRETFAYFNTGRYDRPEMGAFYRADGERHDIICGRWRPSIHMPKDVSRLTLEITDIRAERVQDITEEDAIAEGVERHLDGWKPYGKSDPYDVCETARCSFAMLWDSINGQKPGASWAANSWCWCVSFKRVEA